MNEIEVKIPITEPEQYPKRLIEFGFTEKKARLFEANITFDTGDLKLRHSDELLRLRYTPEKSVVTWKGKSEPGPHKSRPEIESVVASPDNMATIFSRLGYEPRFRYEKFRTEFAREPDGVVTYDETPIGNFLELEGTADWIDKTAEELGFSRSDYVLESYGQLYREYCQRQDIEPTDMVFQKR